VEIGVFLKARLSHITYLYSIIFTDRLNQRYLRQLRFLLIGGILLRKTMVYYGGNQKIHSNLGEFAMYDYNSQQHRLTDTQKTDFKRSDRVFSRSGLWYFHTREGNDVGPFRYRDEAELMLSKFIQELQQIQQDAMASAKPHFRISVVLGRRQQN
jgi:hypothetical protein